MNAVLLCRWCCADFYWRGRCRRCGEHGVRQHMEVPRGMPSYRNRIVLGEYTPPTWRMDPAIRDVLAASEEA